MFNNCRYLSFTFEIGQDLFEGKTLVSLGPAPLLGEQVIISVQRTGFNLTVEQISQWLNLFGKIDGELKYLKSKDIPGVADDTLEVLMRLKRHIPSPLPAFGRKLIVRYRGQPLQCSKCWELGHIRRICTNENNNWMGYIKTLVDKKFIPNNFFGKWYDYLKDHMEILKD